MDQKVDAALIALDKVRNRTFALARPLGYDDLHRQYSTIMSPLVWDIGHVGNFEEYWLLRELHGRAPYNQDLDEVYDPFDNPRSTRAGLPILGLEAATKYLEEVRHEVAARAKTVELDPGNPLVADAYVFNMIVQHEAQHQETMLAALNIRADLDPYALARNATTGKTPVGVHDRVWVEGGSYLAGTDDRAWAYDNERPAHAVSVDGFWIDRYPVTNGRYAKFVESRYVDQDTWSGEGRQWLESTGRAAPQGWERANDGDWVVRRFGHLVPLNPNEPVQHISFFEAEAFARWSGARLPTEFEWEKAAGWDPATQVSRTYPWGDVFLPGVSNLGSSRFSPSPVGSQPGSASAYGVEQMLGETYEWTSSTFIPYPGYATFPYPEYSEVFFDQEYAVLRGASHVTSPDVARTTFRNWDLPQRRQIFSGVRLAWDVT